MSIWPCLRSTVWNLIRDMCWDSVAPYSRSVPTASALGYAVSLLPELELEYFKIRLVLKIRPVSEDSSTGASQRPPISQTTAGCDCACMADFMVLISSSRLTGLDM